MLVHHLALAASLLSVAAAVAVPVSPDSPAGDLVKKAVPAGFVTTSGSHFVLDGKPFYFAGTNAYWLPQLPQTADMDATFKSMAAAGVKVVRTWAFGDLTTAATYYQTISSKGGTINYGANGLQKLDAVVKSSQAHNIKLVLTLTNNWGDYGGMDEYVKKLAADKTVHSSFYTDAAVKKAYKAYVKVLVDRYKSSSTIFAWQLTNEARCVGSLPAGSTCNTAMITAWVNEMAAYVKSLDPNHMVSLGDEGFFNWSGRSEYLYNGGSGMDWDANLKLKNIDYGTFHLYPGAWKITPDQGTQYISDHGYNGNKFGKPVVMEEFGLEAQADKLKYYPTWINAATTKNLGGIMSWQWGQRGLSNGDSSDDGFTIYPDNTQIYNIMKGVAATQNAKSK